jgi:hypothetical protein
VDEATTDVAPALGVPAADDDDVGRQAQVAQGAEQANRLLVLVSTAGSTTKKPTLLPGCASPRAWESKRITLDPRSAAARRRASSAIKL